jgi:hypothetical protein
VSAAHLGEEWLEERLTELSSGVETGAGLPVLAAGAAWVPGMTPSSIRGLHHDVEVWVEDGGLDDASPPRPTVWGWRAGATRGTACRALEAAQAAMEAA